MLIAAIGPLEGLLLVCDLGIGLRATLMQPHSSLDVCYTTVGHLLTCTEGYSGRVIRMLWQRVARFPVERAIIKFNIFFDLSKFIALMRL